MFAKLDDLEGQVEMFVFAKPPASAGRGDRGRQGRARPRPRRPQGARPDELVVQEAERFEPDEVEIARAKAKAAAAAEPGSILIKVDAARAGSTADRGAEGGLRDVPRRLARCCSRCGPGQGSGGCGSATEFRVDATPALRAELDELLGSAALAA